MIKIPMMMLPSCPLHCLPGEVPPLPGQELQLLAGDAAAASLEILPGGIRAGLSPRLGCFILCSLHTFVSWSHCTDPGELEALGDEREELCFGGFCAAQPPLSLRGAELRWEYLIKLLTGGLGLLGTALSLSSALAAGTCQCHPWSYQNTDLG